MNKRFDKKVVECDALEVHKKSYTLETEWLQALLLRAGISKILIKKALNDDNYSAETWRDYLFDQRGITITNNLKTKTVSVFQISFETGNKVKIGEWKKPTVTRIKRGSDIICELKLNYWQVI